MVLTALIAILRSGVLLKSACIAKVSSDLARAAHIIAASFGHPSASYVPFLTELQGEQKSMLIIHCF